MRGREGPNGGITRFALLGAIIISSLLISFQRNSERQASGLEITAQETVSPLANALNVPLRHFESLLSKFSERRRVLADNIKLRDEVHMLRERQARYDNLAVKVARYEAILGVDTETDVPLKKIAARAIGETDGPFLRSLLLNVGSRDGVKMGNPVMSTEGLVGHIINLGPNTARVLRVSDLNSRIAVVSADTGSTAILAGDNTPFPKLSFVNQRQKWVLGDRVITSGDDGFLPRGLEVGVVVQGKSGGLRVRLSSHSSPVDWVWVSPYKKLIAPKEPVNPEDNSVADNEVEATNTP